MFFTNYFFNQDELFRNTMPTLVSSIRILHASPTAPAVDVYANNILIAKNLPFGTVSKYVEAPPGETTVSIYVAGTKDKPIFNKVVDLTPNSFFTAAAINLPSDLSLELIQDADGSLSPSLSFLRCIQLSPISPLLDVSILNGRKLFKYLEYKEQTGYLPLSAGVYDFVIFPSNAIVFDTVIPQVKLEFGKFYTLYCLGIIGSTSKLMGIIVQDGR